MTEATLIRLVPEAVEANAPSQADLQQRWHIPDADHALLQQLQVCQKKHLGLLLQRLSAAQTQPGLPGI